MDWLVQTFRDNPAIPIFLTIAVGFWVGKFKYKGFSLGTVTSVLLVGVLVGQMDIPISGPLKSVFFLLFLFAIGYSVGPQFFRSLKGDGLKEVGFACILCLLCLGVTYAMARIMGYNSGEAAGLFAGAQTMSANIGVSTDTINTMPLDAATKASYVEVIPVAYAVCYVFGTIGSAYILSAIGPMMMGGMKKVKADTVALEKEMNTSAASSDPAFINASRPVVFRAYKIDNDMFASPKSVADVEKMFAGRGVRLFVERARIGGEVKEAEPALMLANGDTVVLTGRREFIIGDESWIGPEVNDVELLNFPVEQLPVMLAKKQYRGMTVEQFRSLPLMDGIMIKTIERSGVAIPVYAKTKLQSGDMLTLIGMEKEVNAAAKQIGYADRPTVASDMVLVGLGIAIGCIIGALAIHAGGVPISLSTSGGALISGLVCGWLRSKHPTFGRIPQPAVWVFNNLGLNLFIAVVGITSGPSFITGFKEVGLSMFLVGIVCTSVPLLLGVLIGYKWFKFRPAICLGCCAGSRTTTAALGAIQDALGSSIPAMGYTVTYAIGNTLIILMGVAIPLLMM